MQPIATMSALNDVSELLLTPPRPAIQRSGPLQLALRMPLSSLWIALRFMLVPLLWVPYRLGSRMRWAYSIDAFMKRTCYPLTEGPDPDSARSVAPRLAPGDPLPSVTVQVDGRAVDLASVARGQRLLLVLFRGSWCPYSRLHLSDLASLQDQLRAAEVCVLAVSVHDDAAWWRTKGVRFSVAHDPSGRIYQALGVAIDPPISHRVWGMLVPHESVFLFDRDGALIASDTRRLSSFKTKQKFLSAAQWLRAARAP